MLPEKFLNIILHLFLTYFFFLKFIVKDSVEENMLKIQNMKRELAAGAFGTKKTDADEMKQAKINEIRTLIDL